MKLLANNETFEAEKIIKENNNIIGYDINNNEIFSFKGISDFSGFVLQDDNGNAIEFELPLKTEIEIQSESISNLGQTVVQEKIKNMQKDTIISNLGQELSKLKLDIIKLQGGK